MYRCKLVACFFLFFFTKSCFIVSIHKVFPVIYKTCARNSKQEQRFDTQVLINAAMKGLFDAAVKGQAGAVPSLCQYMVLL